MTLIEFLQKRANLQKEIFTLEDNFFNSAKTHNITFELVPNTEKLIIQVTNFGKTERFEMMLKTFMELVECGNKLFN